MKAIALVGLPGSGKTTVGRRLAKRLGMQFADSDAQIEASLGCSIRSFFEKEGEERFRDMESETLAKILMDTDTSCVLSTGGGAVLRPQNRKLLQENCIVVYLRASVHDLFRRVKKDHKRPLLQVSNPMKALEDLWRVRDPLYHEIAHIVVDTGRPPVQVLVGRVAMQIELGQYQ